MLTCSYFPHLTKIFFFCFFLCIFPYCSRSFGLTWSCLLLLSPVYPGLSYFSLYLLSLSQLHLLYLFASILFKLSHLDLFLIYLVFPSLAYFEYFWVFQVPDSMKWGGSGWGRAVRGRRCRGRRRRWCDWADSGPDSVRAIDSHCGAGRRSTAAAADCESRGAARCGRGRRLCPAPAFSCRRPCNSPPTSRAGKSKSPDTRHDSSSCRWLRSEPTGRPLRWATKPERPRPRPGTNRGSGVAETYRCGRCFGRTDSTTGILKCSTSLNCWFAATRYAIARSTGTFHDLMSQYSALELVK